MITRRKFLQTLEAITLSSTIGCVTNQKPWEPPLKCTYFKDQRSPLRLVYLPDEHHPEYQEAMIKFLDQHTAPHDGIALEGLSGSLNEEYKKQIEQAEKEKDQYKVIKENLRQQLKKQKDPGALFLQSYLTFTFGASFLKNNPQSGNPEYLQTSPGTNYALHLCQKARVFGFERLDLYQQAQEITTSYQHNFFHDFYEEKKKDQEKNAWILKFMEEYFDLEKIAKAQEILKRYQIVSDRDLKKARDSISRKREVHAIKNIAASFPKGLVWMIMGRAHQEGICAEAEKNSISIAAAKLPF